jgi:hypothetical protein
MQHQTHLTAERIAALADEPASLTERSHLANCAACNAELAAAQRLVRMALTDIPAIEQPVSSWERLSPALRAEGLVRSPAFAVNGDPPAGRSRSNHWRWMAQTAAGLFLAVGGAVVGRASATLPSPEIAANAGATDSNFSSTTEALQTLERASDQYQRAVAYLAANDSSVTLRGRDAAELYRARLDAFDQAATAARTALYRAPQDPVLNQYYISTLGARDLTLRQMGEVVPVSSTQRTRF